MDHCLGPEYDIWTQFNSQTYSPALKGDALANSHPIEVCVEGRGREGEGKEIVLLSCHPCSGADWGGVIVVKLCTAVSLDVT